MRIAVAAIVSRSETDMQQYDTVIRQVRIVDGSGHEP